MRRNLTLVVTCTDRKSAPVPYERRLRSVKASSFPDRVSEWRDRLAQVEQRRSLRSLYQGESWSLVSRLETAAQHAGFLPQTVVASAGLGLREIGYEAPSYAATFASGSPDTVPGDAGQRVAWWDALNVNNPLIDALASGVDAALLILSPRYAQVLANRLRERGAEADTLVVGGSSLIPAEMRLPADRQLRTSLGGTLNSLNMRMAIAWLDRLTGPNLNNPDAHVGWRAWSGGVRREELHERTPLDDAQVKDMIRGFALEHPGMSKTRALRLLRDSGFACEQRRFGDLYEQQFGVRHD